MSEQKKLYEQCIDCKFAVRNKGGNPIGCIIRNGPEINYDGICQNRAFWWTKPPEKTGVTKKVLVALAIILSFVTVIAGMAWLSVKLLRAIAPKVNTDNLPLYFPRSRR